MGQTPRGGKMILSIRSGKVIFSTGNGCPNELVSTKGNNMRCNYVSILALSIVISSTLKSLSEQFFVTEDDIVMTNEKGETILDPKKLEVARMSKFSRPPGEDPQGNWGVVSEGFQMSVRFDKESFVVGEPIVATVVIRNVSDRPLWYWISVPDLDSIIVINDQKTQVMR